MKKIVKRFQSLINKYLPRSEFTKGVFAISSGTMAGQVIVLIVTPIITRLYSPSDYGVLAVYASVIGVIAVISSLRYELAIPLPKDDQTAANVLVLALIICLSISIVSGVALWCLGGYLVTFTKTPALKAYLWLIPLGTFGAGSYTIFSLWAVRANNYRKLGQTKLTQGIMLVVTQIALGILNIKPLGLLLGLLAGHTAGIGTLAVSTLKINKQIFKKVSFDRVLMVAKRYRRFPLFSSYTSFIDAISCQAPAFLLAALYGPSVAGLYAFSQRVISAPLVLVGKSVDQVYFGEASRLINNDPSGKSLLRIYFRTANKMFLLGILFVIPLFLFSPVLFELLFGKIWREAGHYVQIMAPMFLVQFVIAPLSQTLNVIERQDIQLFWVIIWLFGVTISFVITYYFNLAAAYAIALLSLMMIISYLLHFFLCVYMLKNLDSK